MRVLDCRGIYPVFHSITRSETVVSEGVELNCNIEGGGASDAEAVGKGGLGHL